MMNRTRGRGPFGGGTVAPSSCSLRGPDVGVPPLVRRDPAEGGGPVRVLLDVRERVVQDDRIALELEVFEACRKVDGRHAGHRTRVRRRATREGDPRRGAAAPCRGAAPRAGPTVRAGDPSPAHDRSFAPLDSRSHGARPHPLPVGRGRDRGDAPGRGAAGACRADHDRARRRCGAASEDRRPSAPRGLVRPRDASRPARPRWRSICSASSGSRAFRRTGRPDSRPSTRS